MVTLVPCATKVKKVSAEKILAVRAKKSVVAANSGAVKSKKRGLPVAGKKTKHGQQKTPYQVCGIMVEVVSLLDSSSLFS